MSGLSKSRYVAGIQCPKMLWMHEHMPEHFDESALNQTRLEAGNEVGDLAMGYYGSYTEVPYEADNYDDMIQRTQELIASGEQVICEASFSFEGNFCMVDILRVDADGGMHIVEVKSSTKVKPQHLSDMAYQYWVLSACGYTVKSVSLMHLRKDWVRKDELDLKQLFEVEDCTQQVLSMQPQVGANIAQFRELMESESEPECKIGGQCFSPYECGFRKWCWRNVPKPSVFDLYRMDKDRAAELYYQGITTPEQVRGRSGLTAIQNLQAERQTFVDKQGLVQFISSLRFPLYFLDFETIQPAIPPYPNAWVYEQIPTQYSLHWIRHEGGRLNHTEFLAEAGSDPRRALAERLCSDIPQNACTLAYNMSFERGRILELAKLFPDLAEHLKSIADGMRDLIVPFRGGMYYTPEMGGSFSIKSVLPALFPNDPELNYQNLEGVHDGGEAMVAFERLSELDEVERTRVREQLLRYCELDTLAMVKIWERLNKLVRGESWVGYYVQPEGSREDRAAVLRAKMRMSNIAAPPFPEGAYSYKGVCIKPGDERYFTSKEEVEELYDITLEEGLKRL